MDVTSAMIEFAGGSRGRNSVAFISRPIKSGKYPSVLVIQGIWGLVDHLKGVTARLAREGYVAVAPDLFDGKVVSGLEEGRRIRSEFAEEKFLGDLKGALKYLRGLNHVEPSKIGSVGFCLGGYLSILLACHEKISACVVFYGDNPVPINIVRNLSCPLLGLYGGKDPRIPESDIKVLKGALIKYRKNFDIRVYPEAAHAFFDESRPNYRAEDATDAWNRTLAFFSKYLKV